MCRYRSTYTYIHREIHVHIHMHTPKATQTSYLRASASSQKPVAGMRYTMEFTHGTVVCCIWKSVGTRKYTLSLYSRQQIVLLRSRSTVECNMPFPSCVFVSFVWFSLPLVLPCFLSSCFKACPVVLDSSCLSLLVSVPCFLIRLPVRAKLTNLESRLVG